MRHTSEAKSLDASERRVHTRLDLEVKVDLFSDDTFFTGFTENVSEGGLFICTTAPFSLGDELSIKVSLMGGPAREYGVVVRWIRPPGGIGGLPGGIGVQFKELHDDHLTELQDFIDSGVKETLFMDLD